MTAKDLIPSWLTSWVAWRNFYTEKDKEPFHLLKEEMGVDKLPASLSFIKSHNGECPYCRDDSIITNSRLGLVYCICKLLDKIQVLENQHKDIRTPVEATSLDDITYPREMGDKYKRTMPLLVQASKDFIKSPDSWMLVSGLLGAGKSHVLKAINAAFMPMSLYINAGDLEKKMHLYRKDDDLGYFYNVLANAPVLIIDDVGVEYGGQLLSSAIEQIVDSRYERWPDYPMVIATNMPDARFKTYIPRASDRIYDQARTKILKISNDHSIRSLPKAARR